MSEFNPLQLCYINSLKKQIEEANEVINDVDEYSLYWPTVHENKNAWEYYENSKLKEYKKKYKVKDE